MDPVKLFAVSCLLAVATPQGQAQSLERYLTQTGVRTFAQAAQPSHPEGESASSPERLRLPLDVTQKFFQEFLKRGKALHSHADISYILETGYRGTRHEARWDQCIEKGILQTCAGPNSYHDDIAVYVYSKNRGDPGLTLHIGLDGTILRIFITAYRDSPGYVIEKPTSESVNSRIRGDIIELVQAFIEAE